ncbi:hypothetical protein HIM_06110 [Hirsutella minnesotensis 3608]|uniref:Membrane insertase YidC/Oxa/ALB C-terminal domain-containing protein n=1 Tax=Hirsutella minnesotensis 3608 TaxID=1043627 RepID=A0A0F8A510_9HYPO|nr:hypothetical protein HIM_06110 [Hirsutella minnesotensis 3608]
MAPKKKLAQPTSASEQAAATAQCHPVRHASKQGNLALLAPNRARQKTCPEPLDEQPPAAAEAVRPVDPTPENVVPAPPTEPAVPASEVDLSSISELVSAEEILKMPEELGFLSAIGLDFGWGPSTVMQWVLEHVHVWTGLGWGGSIVVTSLLIRVALLYPQLRSLQFAAINQEMQKDPRSLEAKKLLQQAYAGTSEERMMRRQQYSVINKALRERYNVSSFDVLWGLLPIPFTFGLFRVLRNMTYIPVPSLETAGFLWFEDLVATDPYYILPVLSTAAMAGTVLVNMWVSPKTAQQEAMKPILAFVSLSGLVITCYLSAALNLMTVALGGATLASTLVFAIPSVRRRFGLPMRANPSPMSVKATYEPPRSAPAPTGIRERLSENLNGMKKSVSDSVSTYTGAITGGSEQDRAERNRKDLIRRLEAKRKEQEREAFEQKYKR